MSPSKLLIATATADTEFALNFFDFDNKKAVAIFEDFMKRPNNDRCLDDEIGRRIKITDEEVKDKIRKLIDSDNPQALQQIINKTERNDIIRELKEAGASFRQLERITGLGRRIIERV